MPEDSACWTGVAGTGTGTGAGTGKPTGATAGTSAAPTVVIAQSTLPPSLPAALEPTKAPEQIPQSTLPKTELLSTTIMSEASAPAVETITTELREPPTTRLQLETVHAPSSPATAEVVAALAIGESGPSISGKGSEGMRPSGSSLLENTIDSAMHPFADVEQDYVACDRASDLAFINCHIGQTVIVDDEVSVTQMRIVFPKSLFSPQESHSRNSPSLPPLKTTPNVSSCTRTTSAATGRSSETTPVSAAVTVQANTDRRGSNAIHYTECNGDSGNNGLPVGRRDMYIAGDDSTYPPSTVASSPTEYFPSYIIPPIPSFTDIDLPFDKVRTRSADSFSRRGGHMSTNDYGDIGGARSSAAHVYQSRESARGSALGSHQTQGRSQQDNMSDNQSASELVPEYDPSIFDQIQSDDNGVYIIWSTPSDSGTVAPSSSSAVDSLPATTQGNIRNGSVSSAATSIQVMQNNTPSSPPEPSSAPKRWSAGEAFKGRDKGRDSFENDRAHAQKRNDATASEVPRPSTAHASTDSSSGTSNPISPGFAKPLERLGGTISIIRPASSVALSSSKVASASTVATNSNVSINSSEQRVIMAATVEKLVEKLTSDIDYTFLTDFFLIYRLFISPLALLKLLMARFRWALTEDSPQRQIVRIRTFVTMRHWLLNYFEYDFMGSKGLRRTLVQSLRSLSEHPIVSSSVRDQRIVKELRRLFQLKRKIHSREMTQMALERPPVQQHEGAARRSTQRRPANLERTQIRLSSSKRSSVETSGNRQTRLHQSIIAQDEELDRSNDEGSSADESTDQEFDLSSTGSQSEEDMYEEGARYAIQRGQRDSQRNSDGETEDTDFEDDSIDDGETPAEALTNSSHLPSPGFSTGSDNKADPDCVSSLAFTDNGGELPGSSYSKGHTAHLHSSDMSDHSPHHHRSHTVPRAHDARPQPRPLSYVDAGIDSSSSFAISPPDSPRPLEPYINPPPRSTISGEKKKTWSQYMVATVEQLSKVKRVFLPKSSSQDLRHHHSSAFSHSLITGSGGGRRGSIQDLVGMGHVSSASGAARYWSDDRTYRNGNKMSRQSTNANTNTATNSVVSSSEGNRLLRDELQGATDTRRRRSIVTTGWSSDEEDLQSESTGRSNAQTPTRGRSSRVDIRLVSRLLEADTRPWQLEKALVSSDVHLTEDSRQIAPDEGEQQEQPTPNILRRFSLPLNGLVAAKEVLELDPNTIMDWDEEEEEHCSSSSNLALPSSSRPLRRTAQKRDNRASWMTYSSTNSSVFGAVLSQGHLPPSQAINESSDAGNVDRFMERLYNSHTSNGTPEPTKDGPGTPRPEGHGMRRKSIEVIHDRDPVGEAARFPGSEVSGIKTMGADGAKQELREDGDIDGPNPDTSPRRNRTLAQHPHRQTVPIMHLHYHHHYLQHRQSESLEPEYPQQRRHSVEVQSMGSWVASSLQQQKERKRGYQTNMASTAAHAPGSGSRTLLEGAAYAAALQETQRQVQLLTNQDNNNGQSKGTWRQVPPVSLQSLGRHQGQTHPRPVAAVSPISPLSGTQIRSCSDPYLLLQMTADQETAPPLAARPLPKSYPATRGSNAHRMPSPMHHPTQGGHYQFNHSHENIYNQQRSPMNPRFQSIISPTRESLRPAPSIVLRYRSEHIAQQLCLIEREHLNQIPWYELVNAGWKKKQSDAAATEDNSGANKYEAEGCDVSGIGGAAMSNTLGENDLNPQAAPLSRRAANPWPLSRTHTSQTARTHTQRFAHQGHTKDSPSVTQLVDRFNLMCHWVSSEILKTTDLDLRVKVVEKFIRIAHTCYNHSNFSSLTQIMLGLQNHEVSRLSRTWARVRSQETRIMQDLEEFTSMFHNWKHLRGAMKNIADEWGGATGTGASSAGQQEGSAAGALTTASAGSPGSGKQSSMSGVGANLFSKMAGKDKEKEKDRDKSRQQSPLAGGHPRHISHNHSSSFGKTSGNSQVFPSLVSSLSKDKDKDKDKDKEGINAMPPQQQQQQQNQQQQQPHGGCIPFLAVYLSDLLYNTELPSYVESKMSTSFSSVLQQSHPHTADFSATQLPVSPQSVASMIYNSYPASYPTFSEVPSAAAFASSYASPLPLALMVNMHKHRTIATIIKRILTFRTMANRYPFVKETDVYDQLMAVESVDQAEMERLSELCEEKASSSALASPVFAK